MAVTDSCGRPLRSEVDSMPRPVTAPPRVIVLSCGTTNGIRPCGRVASTRSSYVVMPPTTAARAAGSTCSTRLNAEASSPAAPPAQGAARRLRVLGAGSRNRNRFEVRLASRTGAPGGRAA